MAMGSSSSSQSSGCVMSKGEIRAALQGKEAVQLFGGNFCSKEIGFLANELAKAENASRVTSLVFLCVTGSFYAHTIVGDEGMEHLPLQEGALNILEAVVDAGRISKLILHDVGITPLIMQRMVPALKRNNSLKCLDLGNNPLGPEGGRELAQALKDEGAALEELHLSDCQLGKTGIDEITQRRSFITRCLSRFLCVETMLFRQDALQKC